MTEETGVRPIKRFVLLLDDQPERMENGVWVHAGIGRSRHMDFTVVRVGERENVEIGQGDRVVLADPDAGRRVKLDGIQYRLVRADDIVAVCEEAE